MRTFPNLTEPKKTDFIELINYSGDDTFNLITQNLIPKSIEQTTAVANQFKPYRSVVLCQKIYEFCRAYINYRFDKEGTEQIRLPRRTWADRQKGVDCEDFTIFISSILHNLKVNHTIKMVDFGQGWQHIYIVVGDVILDPVQDKFNYEDSYEIAREYDFTFSLIPSIGHSGRKTTFKVQKNISTLKIKYKYRLRLQLQSKPLISTT